MNSYKEYEVNLKQNDEPMIQEHLVNIQILLRYECIFLKTQRFHGRHLLIRFLNYIFITMMNNWLQLTRVNLH